MKRAVSDDDQSKRQESVGGSSGNKKPKEDKGAETPAQAEPTSSSPPAASNSNGEAPPKQEDSTELSLVAKGGEGVPAGTGGGGGSYPNPSNFAERLMHVLQNEIATEALWWLGEGEAIAVHPDKIQENPVLASHFQGSRYSSFVRNLNRWGFRRVSYYTLPDTVVSFHNSLFQRNKPQMVKHMKVDSDVQEVVAQHQTENELKEPAKLEAAAAAEGSGSGGAEINAPTESQQDAMRQLLSAHSTSTEQQPPSQQRQLSLDQNLPPQQGAAEISLQDQVAALLRERVAQQQQQQQNQPQQQPAAFLNPQAMSTGTGNNPSSIELLERLLHLSQQYLSAPSSDTADAAPVRTVLNLLLVLGRQEVVYRKEQEQRNSQNAVQQLMLQLTQATGNQQQQQLPGMEQNHGQNLMQQLLLQHNLGGQQQQQHQQQLLQHEQAQPDSTNAALLRQLLQRAGHPIQTNIQQPSIQAPPGQQQQNIQQLQQQQQQGGSENISQLLQLLRQQQQNN